MVNQHAVSSSEFLCVCVLCLLLLEKKYMYVTKTSRFHNFNMCLYQTQNVIGFFECLRLCVIFRFLLFKLINWVIFRVVWVWHLCLLIRCVEARVTDPICAENVPLCVYSYVRRYSIQASISLQVPLIARVLMKLWRHHPRLRLKISPSRQTVTTETYYISFSLFTACDHMSSI